MLVSAGFNFFWLNSNYAVLSEKQGEKKEPVFQRSYDAALPIIAYSLVIALAFAALITGVELSIVQAGILLYLVLTGTNRITGLFSGRGKAQLIREDLYFAIVIGLICMTFYLHWITTK